MLLYNKCKFSRSFRQSTEATSSFLALPKSVFVTKEVNAKAIPETGNGGSWGCEKSRLPHFLGIGSQMAVRLSALRT
jgi:hypothetical protein